jgi:iron complex transport system substrate-binding protein
MRKTSVFFTFLGVVFTLTLLSACGGQTKQTNEHTVTSESSLRKVTDSIGEVLIPKEPHKIAVTHQQLLDWLLPLGIHAQIAPRATATDDFYSYFPEDQFKKITLYRWN